MIQGINIVTKYFCIPQAPFYYAKHVQVNVLFALYQPKKGLIILCVTYLSKLV